MQLGEIASVKTGLVLTRKKAEVQYDAQATYKLITIKNISEEGWIENDSFEEFISNDILAKRYFTETGDVLMRLSQPFTAVYIDEEHRGLLIPSYFAIIKVNQEVVLPQYMAWYLNTDFVKKELERAHAGSRIPSTNINVIRNLSVKLTTLSNQEKLIELYCLHQKEKQLYKQLIAEKEKWFQGITQQILQEKTRR